MNPISRWFVNHVKGRANSRLYAWLQGHLVLPPAAVCLEVGCGNGNMAVRILEGMSPSRFVATDIDLQQLEAAHRFIERQYSGTVPAGLELRPADMLRLPFPDRGFDAVFAFASLHHAGPRHRDPSHLPQALTEIDRVLRPDGYLAYEEFLHKERLRGWLVSHGYRFTAQEHRWRRERAVVQKPSGPGNDPADGVVA